MIKKKIIFKKPRFEIRKVDSDGSEQIEICSLSEFTDQVEDIHMDRRGFLKLSAFAGVTSSVAATATISYGAEDHGKYIAMPKEHVRVVTGEITKIDKVKKSICVMEDKKKEEICVNVSPETSIERNGEKKTIANLKKGDIITVGYTIDITGEKIATSIEVIGYYKTSNPTPSYIPTYPKSRKPCGGSNIYCS
ncbi:MAG: hypothetical protein GY795_32025 [Desulfobacterales bacterium]|nr:hypothetical protein [Desulfobacterales bacterium]